MALAAGARLGPYEVLSLLGAGGMGEVYRGRDEKLGRDVAIKVLPASMAHDRDRLVRFEREAHVLASLNHTHIAGIYGVEEKDGIHALVLELVEGHTLAEVLAERRTLPLREALDIARQIADALEAAHDKAIIHRDLKPANIKITPDGVVKVLDFGLAKIAADDSATNLSVSPTISVVATRAGVILGTVWDMSPEQARGKTVDKRSDIWAFGCVLFEMLAGVRAFPGETVSDVVAAILTREPDWQRLPSDIPSNLNQLLRRCLDKDPRQRLRDIGDARPDLQPADRPAVDIRQSGPLSRSRRVPAFAGVAAGIVVGAIAAIAMSRVLTGRPPSDSPRVSRSLIAISPAEHLQALAVDRVVNEGRPSRTAFTWSPDGRSIVFSAARENVQQLYVRRLDRLEATPIDDTAGASDPFFSPDGRWIGFFAGGVLKKVRLDGGGPATVICQADAAPVGGTWGSDDTIVFSRHRQGLWRIPAVGGTPQQLTKPDIANGEVKHLLPHFVSGTDVVLFTVTHTPLPRWDDVDIAAQSLAGGGRHKIVEGGADARYSNGFLIYVRRGALMSAPFDIKRLTTTAGSVAVVGDVMQAANMTNESYDSGAGQFSISESGALGYMTGGVFPDPERQLVWVDRSGTASPLPLPSRAYLAPRISPDGQRVAVWTQGDRNVWLYDLARGALSPVTSEARNARPIWTPDGKRLVYGSASAGEEDLVWKEVGESGKPEVVMKNSGTSIGASSWLPDGRAMAIVTARGQNNLAEDIMLLRLDGDREPQPLVSSRFSEAYPAFSPDGRWLAYASDESGRQEVYVQPFPGPGPRQQVSTQGGTAPAWSHDGRELFYVTAETKGGQAAATAMMSVPVTLSPTFTVSTSRLLFKGRYGATALVRGYDVTQDGKRFLMVQQKERMPLAADQIVLVENWIEELKRR